MRDVVANLRSSIPIIIIIGRSTTSYYLLPLLLVLLVLVVVVLVSIIIAENYSKKQLLVHLNLRRIARCCLLPIRPQRKHFRVALLLFKWLVSPMRMKPICGRLY
jgi:hypothetical protein